MSKVEVNQISSQCGSTLTIGQSGDTVTLAAGATQTGFGRTGTVDWDTTAKTTSFTAVSGNGYFVNTTSAAITLTLPASPSAGDIVAFKDYAYTFATNNLTIDRNGSPIGGANGANIVLNTDGVSLVLVYVDGTQGWVPTQDDSSVLKAESYIVATGGTITTCGNYKIHTFTGPGTFTVCSVSSTPSENTVDYLVVAGGGGGSYYGAGGGAGGLRYYLNTTNSPSPTSPALPINNFPAGTAITVTATGYPVTVGAGATGAPIGPPQAQPTNDGSNSIFSTITSTGGGGAGQYGNPCGVAGRNGGSGGGGGMGEGGSGGTGGSGNTPPVSPSQGNGGGSSGKAGPTGYGPGGGGGGALAAGGATPTTCNSSGDGKAGGVGAGFAGVFGTSNGECSAAIQYFSGGGGGSNGNSGPSGGAGGLGGGGDGNTTNGQPGAIADGTANTGGGGGGFLNAPDRGSQGGSGIVVIRYRYQ